MYKAPKEKSHSEYPVLSALLNDLHHNLHEQNGFNYLIAMCIGFISVQLHISFFSLLHFHFPSSYRMELLGTGKRPLHAPSSL